MFHDSRLLEQDRFLTDRTELRGTANRRVGECVDIMSGISRCEPALAYEGGLRASVTLGNFSAELEVLGEERSSKVLDQGLEAARYRGRGSRSALLVH